MQRYRYIKKTTGRKIKRGVIEAVGRKEAMTELRQDGCVVIELKKCRDSYAGRKLSDFRGRLKPKQKALLFSELSYLLPIGNSLHSSLTMLLRNNKDRRWQNTINHIIKSLDDTGSFSAALESTGKFGSDIIYQVQSGEESGNLPEVLQKLSGKFEKSAGYIKKLVALMIYPALLFVGLYFVIKLMSAEIIPQLVSFIEETGGELPGISKIVIAASLAISRYGLLCFVLFLMLIAAFRMILKNKTLRYIFDRGKLHIPVVGSILRDTDIVKFNKVFAAMYESGNELKTILNCSAETLKNTYLSKLARDTTEEIVEAGTAFTQAFSASGLYNPEDVQLLDVGAETYSLSQILEKIAERKSEDIEYKLISLTNAIPLLSIVVIGVIIGIFVIGIYLPLTSITSGNFNISY